MSASKLAEAVGLLEQARSYENRTASGRHQYLLSALAILRPLAAEPDPQERALAVLRGIVMDVDALSPAVHEYGSSDLSPVARQLLIGDVFGAGFEHCRAKALHVLQHGASGWAPASEEPALDMKQEGG